MNKENRSAAGLRRSAVAERIRLREEWSELKGRESNDKQKNILTKKQTNATATSVAKTGTNANRCRKPSSRNLQQTDSVLCGVVALVEVGAEARALPLRAALTALGATVLPAWSPLVTHLVWSQGGCRSTRARARALASRLVSPLWVEACAAAARRLPEQAFPAAARASDLPSPRTLTRLLKKAESENISLSALLTDSTDEKEKQLRLRLSSDNDTSFTDTSQDVSHNTSRDTTHDTSRDTTHDTSRESDQGSKTQNKVPRPAPATKAIPSKSRRKLFTQKEAEEEEEDSEEAGSPPTAKPRKPSYKPASRAKLVKPAPTAHRKELARAERLARKIVTGCTPLPRRKEHKFRIVLTGMCRSERRLVSAAVKSLPARLQPAVDRRTTHVLVGTFLHDDDYNKTTAAGVPTQNVPPPVPKPRTLNALCGAARGCRVLTAQWALDSQASGKWLHHYGYEVPYLKKISQKARLERSAWSGLRAEYAYDVFCGMRVRVSRHAERPHAARALLRLCGAVVQEDNDEVPRTQTAIPSQDAAGGRRLLSQYYVTQRPDCEYDVRVGGAEGDVTAAWVTDSVAAARMRNTRLYLVADAISEQMARLGC